MKANKPYLILFLLIAGLSFSGAVALPQQTAGQMFEKALYLEEAKGSLQDAIDLYNQIAENKNADQSFQAKALLHMGLCYEKLGKKEAVRSYQRLVDNFPTYKNEVVIARERLSQLLLLAENVAKKSVTPEFTRIEIPTKPGNGVLSPDGRKLAYISDKSLWIVPVHGKTNPNISGEPVRLTDPMNAWDLANMCVVWSANGKWLAFYVTENREDVIYIVSVDGGKPVKVSLDQKRPDIGGYDYRMSLSPDGKTIAFVNRDDNKNSFISTISTQGGKQSKITGPGTREPVYSPDGKLIAYVKIKPEGNLGDEIWVIPSSGGESVLVSHEADVVKSPVWSPDGSMIAFLARKYEKGWANNSNELWIAAIDRNGKPTGLTTKTDLNNPTTLMLAGWSPDNKIGIWLEEPEKNVLYSVPAHGGQAMQVTSKNSWMPCWSPDGKYMYFDGINTDNFAGVESVLATGGKVSRIPISFRETIQPEMPIGGISVSPDGKNVVFETYYNNGLANQKKPEGFHHIITSPVNGGTPFELTTNSLLDGYPEWSPDGKYIAFIRQDDEATGGNIYTIVAEGGTPKKITSFEDSVTFGRIDWSPDGKWIGFFSANNTIKMIPAEGSNSKIVIKDVESNSHFGLSFSPDGDKIAYSNKEKLFVADINSGKKEEVQTGIDAIPQMPAWSPDGSKIAFCAYEKGETDLWFMEDFLPLNKSNNLVKKEEIIPLFTKIKIPTKLWAFVALSPNGKDLALVSDDKLWKMPVTGNLGPEYPGIPVQLNTEDIKVEASGISWSGDGKWIAFNNLPQSNENSMKIPNQSIYRIPSNGGNPYEILNNYRDSYYVNYRISLSPDGENLAYSSVENNEQHIYTTQVTGGSPKQLVDIQAREPVYSPNGKWIAYAEDKNLGKDGGDLWVIPAVGGVPKLVAKAGIASNPVWSPDGKMLAFLDLNKKKQVNLVKLQQDGETMGKVYSIDAPAGVENLTVLAGWTPENKIGILATTNREFALFSLPSKGGQAAMVLKDYSWVYQPRWSHDGRQIYYITAPGMGIEQGLNLRLASVSAVGGSGELLPLLTTNDGDTIRTITYQGGNRISPDGKMLISSAWTSKDLNPLNPYFPHLKIWKFSLDGSERVQLTNKSGNYADFCPCWSPDGEKVAFIRCLMTKGNFFLKYDEAGIYIVDSSGNESQILPYSDDKFFFSLSWSPDGKKLAYFTSEKEAPNKSCMNVINLETGKNRVIRELPTVHEYMEMAWSPDSRRIAFNGEEIQVVNIDDGTTENIASSLKDVIIFDMDWSPDGKYFVFGGLKVPKSEFWFLEDFLPLINK